MPNSCVTSNLTEESEKTSPKILAYIAYFKNMPTEKIQNSVIYFWESHTNNQDDKVKTDATINLMYSMFDMQSCEKYEVRTGFLSRYNYLPKPKIECTLSELEEAVIKGEEEAKSWFTRCHPRLPGFEINSWQECINQKINPFFKDCLCMLEEKVKNDKFFQKAYKESVTDYVKKRKANIKNSYDYLIEENAWLLSLPYLHPNKTIYVIHVGNVTNCTNILFSTFDYMKNNTHLILPSFSKEYYSDIIELNAKYRHKKNIGYAIFNNDFCNDNSSEFSKESEYLQTIENMRLENELLSTVIENIPGHIYWLNRANVYLGCNSAYANSLNLSNKNDIIGKGNKDLLHSIKDCKCENNINNIVIDNATSYCNEETIIIDGKNCNFLSNKVSLSSACGKVIGMLGLSVNITEIKSTLQLNMKKQLEFIKTLEQDQFKQIIEHFCHDIRQPIAAISMLIESVKEEKLYKLFSNSINCMNDSIASLSHIYTKNESNDSEQSSFDIHIITIDVLAKIKRKFHNVNFRIETDFCDENFVFIKGDKAQFTKMLFNLFTNSVESFKKQCGILKITTKLQNNYIDIQISDNGCGIEEKILNQIQNRTFINSTKKESHGIGIIQVKNTLQTMHGKMEVESKTDAESKIETGTIINLQIPTTDSLKFLINSLKVKKDDTIVIFDNDKLSHCGIARLLNPYRKNLKIKHFTEIHALINFIGEEFEDAKDIKKDEKYNEKIKLFIGYDLKNYKTIVERALKRFENIQCILLAKEYSEPGIKEIADSYNVKVLSKQILERVRVDFVV